MPIDITMPRLSDTMENGTLLKWNVREGDAVSSGDVVADVETDKATMELTVYDDGTVARLLVDEGQTVEVGTVVAVMTEEGEDADEAEGAGSVAAPRAADEPAVRVAPAVTMTPTDDGATSERLRISPVARPPSAP